MKPIAFSMICAAAFTFSAYAENDLDDEINGLKQRVLKLETKVESIGSTSMPFTYVGESKRIAGVSFTLQGCEFVAESMSCFIIIENDENATTVSLDEVKVQSSNNDWYQSRQISHTVAGYRTFGSNTLHIPLAKNETKQYVVYVNELDSADSFGLQVEVSGYKIRETIFFRGISLQ
ncbi:hypothetical protein [Hirschia maritima]|uniref:hypothetical protein n=1 Tax=Hirschia maritima TaxID=1121961 RepID=UPI0003764F5D|nr:hypothetical protein [Hirschia maritima]